MARKKKHPEHENHERWLISYADFITLLFAFFVVMFASSQADKKKQQQVSESVKTALEKGAQASSEKFTKRGRETNKGTGGTEIGPDKEGGEAPKQAESPAAAAADLKPSMKALDDALEHEIKAGKIEVHMEVRGLVVSLHEGAFFPSGDDKIVAGSYPSIAKIAETLHKLPNPVRLEGHTDSVPIHTERFESNWELSAARSIAMLNLLSNKYEVARGRFGIAGYADTMPVDTNATDKGRARNRRVDIVILNAQAADQNKPAPGEPTATPTPAATPAAATGAAKAPPAVAGKTPPPVAATPPPPPPPADGRPSPLPPTKTGRTGKPIAKTAPAPGTKG